MLLPWIVTLAALPAVLGLGVALWIGQKLADRVKEQWPEAKAALLQLWRE